MALIRKNAAGSDSYGHTWPEDGAVVEIEDGDQIAALMAIPDGGFTEVIRGGEAPEPEGDGDGQPPTAEDISEVDPGAENLEAPATTAAKKTAARKTVASKPE
ncbi:hypothetical protein [Streptomyces sp. NPDC001389]|uniref:hypothetical protein n=1 Tax=Streptomyces sp. NPDC001389 TaxID=3364569 RepID=UPI0036CA35EB